MQENVEDKHRQIMMNMPISHFTVISEQWQMTHDFCPRNNKFREKI